MNKWQHNIHRAEQYTRWLAEKYDIDLPPDVHVVEWDGPHVKAVTFRRYGTEAGVTILIPNHNWKPTAHDLSETSAKPKPKKLGGVTVHPKWNWSKGYTQTVSQMLRKQSKKNSDKHRSDQYRGWLIERAHERWHKAKAAA